MEPTPLGELLRDVPHRLAGVSASVTVTGICTDTRRIKPGDLFFALKGENSDGHQYVRQALDAGALAAIVSAQPVGDPPGPLIVVEDTVRTLGLAARNYRRRFPIPLVAITGSVGKTSVREMTAAVLRACYRTLSSSKNYNNEIGVPLTLFELSGEHEAAVVEMGMRGLEEIDWLAQVAEPTIGLITNIGHSHLERLGSRDGIAQAKAELLARLPAHGTAILPRHDDYFDYLCSRVPAGCRIITFSDSPEHQPDVAVTVAEGRPTAVINGETTDLFLEPFAPHAARNAAAAVAAGTAMRIPAHLMKDAFRSLQPVEGRLRTLPGKNWMCVVDDCYNAAPESMAAALAMLGTGQSVLSIGRSLPPDCLPLEYARMRRVAILGDMRELGELGPQLHRTVGRQVIDARVNLLITVGNLAMEIAAEAERYAGERGTPGPLHRHFPDSAAAAAGIDFLLAPLDYVLVKGSRAMEMEKIVAVLTGEAGTSPHG